MIPSLLVSDPFFLQGAFFDSPENITEKSTFNFYPFYPRIGSRDDEYRLRFSNLSIDINLLDERLDRGFSDIFWNSRVRRNNCRSGIRR